MSFKKEVLELLISVALKITGLPADQITGETRFEEDLHFKSIDYNRVTLALEDEYDIEVPYMAFKRNATFNEAADYMTKLTGYL